MARYIDADRLLLVLEKNYGHTGGANTLKQLIDMQPTADVEEVRHGEWIWTENGEEDYEQYWICSVCKEKSYIETPYCQDCGAKMDGGSRKR